MKKIILIIVSIIFMANISNAQDKMADLRSKLSYGIKVGLNLSTVYDIKSEDFNVDPKFGFVTGVFVEFSIGKHFGFHPEILFSQKGYKASETDGGIIDYEFTRTSNYIDLPFLISFKPTELLTLVVGPQVSYLIKQKEDITSGDLLDQQVIDLKNDNLRKNTLCFLGGININLNHIVLGARAGWDIQNNDGDGTSTDPRYKNVWYQATIGYKF